jgi:hypothetical protein
VLRTSIAMGSSYLRYAVAMRERLPQVPAVFAAGDIDYRLFQTIVYRTDLITAEQALAAVDAQLAGRGAVAVDGSDLRRGAGRVGAHRPTSPDHRAGRRRTRGAIARPLTATSTDHPFRRRRADARLERHDAATRVVVSEA